MNYMTACISHFVHACYIFCPLLKMCPALNVNEIRHIFESRADIKLCASSFNAITHPVFPALSASCFKRKHAALDI
jgi:hypothetical protein